MKSGLVSASIKKNICIMCFTATEKNFFRLVSWFTHWMCSVGTDGTSWYHTQLNSIVCCSQATLHSLIMSCWYCWRHVARLQDLKRSYKTLTLSSLAPYFSLTISQLCYSRKEGICMVHCSTYGCSSMLPGRHQLSLVLCHISLYAPTHPALPLHNHTLL